MRECRDELVVFDCDAGLSVIGDQQSHLPVFILVVHVDRRRIGIFSGELEHLPAVNAGIGGVEFAWDRTGRAQRNVRVRQRRVCVRRPGGSGGRRSETGGFRFLDLRIRPVFLDVRPLGLRQFRTQPYFLQNFSRRSCVIGSSIVFSSLVVIVHAASCAAQCVGLFGAQLLSGGEASGDLGATLRIGFGGRCCAEFVLAAEGSLELASLPFLTPTRTPDMTCYSSGISEKICCSMPFTRAAKASITLALIRPRGLPPSAHASCLLTSTHTRMHAAMHALASKTEFSVLRSSAAPAQERGHAP